MEAATIIAQCNRLFERYENPPVLAMHQKRVAAVCWFICDHWKGPALDREVLVAAALVHDLGNIVKANMEDNEHSRKLMGPEWVRIDHWRAVQKRIVSKYGKGQHEATENMLIELEVPDRVRELAVGDDFSKNVEVAASNDWEQKVLAHADHRVSPYGIVSLKERLAEGAARYKGRMHLLGDDEALQATYVIQEQIATHLSVPLDAINDENVRPYVERLEAS